MSFLYRKHSTPWTAPWILDDCPALNQHASTYCVCSDLHSTRNSWSLHIACSCSCSCSIFIAGPTSDKYLMVFLGWSRHTVAQMRAHGDRKQEVWVTWPLRIDWKKVSDGFNHGPSPSITSWVFLTTLYLNRYWSLLLTVIIWYMQLCNHV